MYKNKLTPEEALEAIKLRMKYDAKLTLDENKSFVSEQALTNNQLLAMNSGFGPVTAQYADQLAQQGKLTPSTQVPKINQGTPKPPTSKQANPTTQKNIITNNQSLAMKLGFGPVSKEYADQLAQSGKLGKITQSASLNTGMPFPPIAQSPNTPKSSTTPAKPTTSTAPVKPPKTTVPYIPKGLNDTKGVQEFQKWLDSTQGDWAWSPKLQKKYKVEGNPKRGFGKFGPSTEKFWNNPDIRKQFMDFVEGKAQTTSTTTTSTTSTPNVNVVGKQVSATAPTTPITRKSPAQGFQDYMKDKPLGLGTDTQPTPPALTTNKVIANKNTEF